MFFELSRKTIFRILTVFVAFALFAPQAFAWHPTDSKKLDLTIVPEVGEVYDDNVTYSRDNEEWDLITELALGLRLRHEGKKHYFEGLLRDKQQIYARNTNFSNNSPDLSLNYRYDLTKKDHIGIRNTMAYYEQPRTFSEAFGSTSASGRFKYFRNQLDVDYTHDFNERLSVTGRYGQEVNVLSFPGSRDSYLHKAGLDVNFYKTTSTLYSFLYEFVYASFQNADSAQIHAFAGRYRQDLTKQLYFETKAGADVARTYERDTIVRPLFNASLNGDLDKKTTARIMFDTGIEPNAFTQDLFEYYQTSLSIRRQIWKKLSGEASFFYGHGKYRTADISDDYLGGSAELAYDLPNDFKLKLAYSYSRLFSKEREREYDKNVVSLRLVQVF